MLDEQVGKEELEGQFQPSHGGDTGAVSKPTTKEGTDIKVLTLANKAASSYLRPPTKLG